MISVVDFHFCKTVTFDPATRAIGFEDFFTELIAPKLPLRLDRLHLALELRFVDPVNNYLEAAIIYRQRQIFRSAPRQLTVLNVSEGELGIQIDIPDVVFQEYGSYQVQIFFDKIPIHSASLLIKKAL